MHGLRTKIFRDMGQRATGVVKKGEGVVLSVHCVNRNAAIRYLQLHNGVANVAVGAVPNMVFPIPASGTLVLDSAFFTSMGISFKTGIVFAYSTTESTYTAGTPSEQTTHIVYA